MITKFSNKDLIPILESYWMIYEDAESKNRHAARSWIRKNHPEALNRTIQNGIQSDEEMICRELSGLMDNVKLADYKFLQGLARIYFTDMKSNPNDMVRMANKLNGILKIISREPHLSEYDRNLNGLTFDELDRRFSEAVSKNLEDDKENINKGRYSRNSDYEIVKINSFEDAVEYGEYTDWCVTHDEYNYNTYTRNGLGIFYFCLKKGFEDVPEEVGEGCPLDEYGLSMIAVLVGDDGSLWHCTCRWNHANGGNDNIMDTQQISELLGVNFYETFKPRTLEEIMANYEKMRVEDDDVCRKYGYIKIEEKDIYGNPKGLYYIKSVDGVLHKVKIVGDGLGYDDKRGFIKLTDAPYSIYDFAFYLNQSIKTVDIPDGVMFIGENAFHNCTSLTNITIPSSVTSIGRFAFTNCDSLTSITIPSSVTSIGEGAFNSCDSLTSITIPSSVTTIGRGAFAYCNSLESITMHASVTEIDSYTFKYCRSLSSIVIPPSVTTIERHAFTGCGQLKSVEIPETVRYIGIQAFSYCESLTSIVIPNSVTELGMQTFWWCTRLKDVTLPKHLEYQIHKAFERSDIPKIHFKFT